MSLLVLGGQWFAAYLLAFVVVLLWRFWVGLHVSAIETGGEERRGVTFSKHKQSLVKLKFPHYSCSTTFSAVIKKVTCVDETYIHMSVELHAREGIVYVKTHRQVVKQIHISACSKKKPGSLCQRGK